MPAIPLPVRLTVLSLASILSLGACAGKPAGGSLSPEGVHPPADAAEELLAADRAFGTASEQTDVVQGLGAMLADDVVMPRGGSFVVGRDSVLALFRSDTSLAGARLGWTPVRVGVSADGCHGFTLGYATLRGNDGSVTPGKYLTYWVKGSAGWRAAVYRRRRAAAAAQAQPVPPALPARSVAPTLDPGVLRRYRQSLDSAERAFSADAQRVGLRAAFARWGSPDATNMGAAARASFVTGADSIAAAVSEGEPATGSSVSWAPDHGVLVASSGDLGVTMGTIVVNEPDSSGQRAQFAFFTVWRRSGPDQPWRYVAE